MTFDTDVPMSIASKYLFFIITQLEAEFRYNIRITYFYVLSSLLFLEMSPYLIYFSKYLSIKLLFSKDYKIFKQKIRSVY